MNSVLDSFSDPLVQNHLKYTIGLFGMIGLGFGLTGFLLIEVVSQNIIDVAFAPLAFGIILLALTFLIGPVIAGFTSIRIAEGLRADALTIYLTSAIGNFVGYFVMVLVTVLLIAATGGGGSGSGTTGGSSGSVFDLGDLLLPMLAMAIPVALVGAGTVYLHRRVNIH